MQKMIRKLDAALQQLDHGSVDAARLLVEHVRNELSVASSVVDLEQIEATLQHNFLRADR